MTKLREKLRRAFAAILHNKLIVYDPNDPKRERLTSDRLVDSIMPEIEEYERLDVIMGELQRINERLDRWEQIDIENRAAQKAPKGQGGRRSMGENRFIIIGIPEPTKYGYCSDCPLFRRTPGYVHECFMEWGKRNRCGNLRPGPGCPWYKEASDE